MPRCGGRRECSSITHQSRGSRITNISHTIKGMLPKRIQLLRVPKGNDNESIHDFSLQKVSSSAKNLILFQRQAAAMPPRRRLRIKTVMDMLCTRRQETPQTTSRQIEIRWKRMAWTLTMALRKQDSKVTWNQCIVIRDQTAQHFWGSDAIKQAPTTRANLVTQATSYCSQCSRWDEANREEFCNQGATLDEVQTFNSSGNW